MTARDPHPQSRTAPLRRPVVLGAGAGAALLLAAFVAGLVLDWPTSALGLILGAGTLGAALVAAALPAAEDRELVWPAQREPGDAPLLAAVAAHPVRRRWILGGVGIGALAGVGLLAWLGRDEPPTTGWRRGAHLVTAEGQRIRAAEVPIGGFGTVWPEGAARQDLAAVVLVRLSAQVAQPPTVLDWVVGDRLVAYSKVCTHAGCPVGLYQEDSDSLFCPCHQATFDAARGAVPTFGPASRPLPQLPLGVDEDGFLVAIGDFPAPIGPVRG
ncbi:QcrA and Rieske domain-containing protein [Blastococcus sp. SYSU DS1024]